MPFHDIWWQMLFVSDSEEFNKHKPKSSKSFRSHRNYRCDQLSLSSIIQLNGHIFYKHSVECVYYSNGFRFMVSILICIKMLERWNNRAKSHPNTGHLNKINKWHSSLFSKKMTTFTFSSNSSIALHRIGE